MADWVAFKRYVLDNYPVLDDDKEVLSLGFKTGGGRSQTVMLSLVKKDDVEWLLIESPIAKLSSVDLRVALQGVRGMPCGGLAATGTYLTLRHGVPLADLDLQEFERPLALITRGADVLERHLTGGDAF
jgi:hypothetical protein